MSVVLNKITPKQKLIIAKGLLDYQFIMDNWKTDSQEFREVYYEFYLKARWAVMKKPENSNPYFDKLQNTSATSNLIDIIDDLKQKTEQKNYEFSLCSKLLHTINVSSPIYDSKVRDFLSEEMNVDFWFNSGKKVNISTRDKIIHDWNELCRWYDTFLKSPIGKEWVAWFDTNFSSYAQISDVKKIDCIIFATN